MSVHLSIVPIYVSDQQEALRFYTGKLGMEKRMDDPMGPDLRWITVALPGDDVEFVLAAGFGHGDPASQAGNGAGYVLRTDDCRAVYEQWSANGVQFTEPPTEQIWGVQALFQDPDGNGWVLVQRPEGAYAARPAAPGIRTSRPARPLPRPTRPPPRPARRDP